MFRRRWRCGVVSCWGAARGEADKDIAQQLGCSANTVCEWRKRFALCRLDGLGDAPRAGRPCTITQDKVKEVITRTLETTPPDATHWSVRSIAKAVGISHSTVSEICKDHENQTPSHGRVLRSRLIRCSRRKWWTPAGLYLNPPDAAVVGVRRVKNPETAGSGSHCSDFAVDAWCAPSAEHMITAVMAL